MPIAGAFFFDLVGAFLAREVGHGRADALAAAELPDGLLELVLVDVGEDELAAFVEEHLGGFEGDGAGRARDDGAASADAEVHSRSGVGEGRQKLRGADVEGAAASGSSAPTPASVLLCQHRHTSEPSPESPLSPRRSACHSSYVSLVESVPSGRS